ncbi:ribonuclease H-like domain-containing protein [Tanacetum coccineum]
MVNTETPPPITTLSKADKLLAISSITTLVPAKLDLAKSNYSTWAFFFKNHCDDGSLSWYKARLVANRNNQRICVDYDETFSPVVKPATIRTVLSLAASGHWPVHQLDVKNAFLHGTGTLSETVYMRQPPGFRDPQRPNHVCLLQRSLYGLKQAPRAWFQRFAAYASHDILLTAFSIEMLQKIIASLHQEFSMTDLGPTHVDTESKLGVDGSLVSDPTLYCSHVGALRYLTFTRPDLSYAVQQVCLYIHYPREPHLTDLKRILFVPAGSSSSVPADYVSAGHVLVSAELVDGSLSWYRGALTCCLIRNNQQICVDYDETFSPVVKPATIRTVLSLAASGHWHVHQLDVKNAFLHGTGTIHPRQLYKRHASGPPLDFGILSVPYHVLSLPQASHCKGLKQAPNRVMDFSDLQLILATHICFTP